MSLSLKRLLGAAVAGSAIATWLARFKMADRDHYLGAIRAAEHAEV